jgi:hypothetical protein
VKQSLHAQPQALRRCTTYAEQNGLGNIDYLLETMIFGVNKFNALVIIDELDPDLETVLVSRFKFPVEILTLERYAGPNDERIFKFDPFLSDVELQTATRLELDPNAAPAIDPSDIDTVVIPARDEGFNEVFLRENRWYKIRMHSSMIPKIKHIAAYRVAPISAITHTAPVASIEQWPGTNKYVVNFAEPAREIGAIQLVPGGSVHAPQGPRYTSHARLETAHNLDEAF